MQGAQEMKIYDNELDKLSIKMFRGCAQLFIANDYTQYTNSIQNVTAKNASTLWSYTSDRHRDKKHS